MKVQIACISLAALAAVTAAPVSAADWNGGAGSIKDMSGSAAIPVPAPVPIPDYKPSYYFRLDAGLGTMSKPSVSESGFTYGDMIGGANGYDGVAGPDIQSVDPTWFNSDFSRMATFGGGVGYYFGGGWRMDATVEKRSNDQTEFSGSDTWDSHTYYDHDFDPTTPDIYTADTNGNGIADRRTTMTVYDRTNVDGTVWMANLYYDFASSGRRGFTPYVGAGLGLVWNQLDRTHTTQVVSCDNESACGGSTTHYNETSTTEADTVSLAAAAMLGVSYQVSEITSLDVGYRYLFLGGTDFTMDVDGAASRITIGDQHVHQLRAGLRFDVN